MNGRAAPGWPWRDSDLTLVVISGVLGMIAIVVAWFGASGTSSLVDQTVWANLAVGGLAVSAIGQCLWLMRGRRAVGDRRIGLVSFEGTAVERAPVHTGPPSTTGSHRLVRVPGSSLVHVPTCPFVAGKRVEPAAPGAGRSCGVCTP